MERELKIVIAVFLFYLVYGLNSLVDTHTLITPVFLTSTIFVTLALVFAILNRKAASSSVLGLYFIAFLFFALVDEFVIGMLTNAFGTPAFYFLKSRAFGFIAFLIFFSFLFFAVYFFHVQTRNRAVAIALLAMLSACIALFFTDYYLLQEASFQFFCIFYFVFGQRGSELRNKTLRVVSYQLLLVSLLESFEYFI